MNKLYNNENIRTESDKIRQKIIDSGLVYEYIGSREFYKLVEILKEELTKQTSALEMKISDRRKADRPIFNMGKDGSLKSAFIKVSAHYFEGREAISFNEDGFIGVAGWASSENATPMIDALEKWLNFLAYELW